MITFSIVQLEPAEWEKYKEIRLEALKSDPIAFATTYEEAVFYSEEKWREKLENESNIFLFAQIGEKLVGSVTAYLPEENTSHTAILAGVYVNKEFRGNKIAQKLLTALIEKVQQIPDISKIKLWVSETQEPAKALYKSLGFKMVGKAEEIITFQGKEYEELIMEKSLEK